MSAKNTHLAEWKRAAIDQAINLLNPSGKVLLVGFDDGVAAKKLISHNLSSLTIVEEGGEEGAFAEIFAKHHKSVNVIHLPWEKALKTLSTFDAAIFCASSLQEDIHIVNYIYKEDVYALTCQAKELLLKLEEEFSSVKRHFSDQEIEEFYQAEGKESPKELAHFLSKLKKNGQITEQQYNYTIQKYHLVEAKTAITSTTDPLFQFLETFSKSHLAKKGRVVSFLSPEVNKYDNKLFFEKIIANPYLNYTEKLVPITLSSKEVPVKAQLILIENLA